MVITISFFFQVGAVHSYYESLIEADFLGHGLKFEAAGLENLFVDKQKSLEIGPRASSVLSLWVIDPSGQIPLFYLRASSPDEISLTLRC
jgi:hypothetical protein